MLSQTAEHALRALLCLAREGQKSVLRVEEIATAIGAPRDYLAKTLNVLARVGIVSATRGPGGGIRLLANPAVLTVAEVVAPFDPPRPQGMCLLGGRPCDATDPCAAHATWEAVLEHSNAPLRCTTLMDLLNPEGAAPGNSPLDIHERSNHIQRER